MEESRRWEKSGGHLRRFLVPSGSQYPPVGWWVPVICPPVREENTPGGVPLKSRSLRRSNAAQEEGNAAGPQTTSGSHYRPADGQ